MVNDYHAYRNSNAADFFVLAIRHASFKNFSSVILTNVVLFSLMVSPSLFHVVFFCSSAISYSSPSFNNTHLLAWESNIIYSPSFSMRAAPCDLLCTSLHSSPIISVLCLALRAIVWQSTTLFSNSGIASFSFGYTHCNMLLRELYIIDISSLHTFSVGWNHFCRISFGQLMYISMFENAYSFHKVS